MRKKLQRMMWGLLMVCALIALRPLPVSAATKTLIQKDNMTRAEWLYDLVQVFDLSVSVDQYPDNYYPDVKTNHKYYSSIMSVVEKGIIDIEAGDELHPDDLLTREFAAHTMNYCLGYVKQSDLCPFTDTAHIKNVDDAQVSIEREWFETVEDEFKPDKAVTAKEAETMLSDAKESLEKADVSKNVSNYVFADYVIRIPDTVGVRTNDESNVVYLTGFSGEMKAGDVFEYEYYGIAYVYQAVEVRKSGNTTTITTTDAPSDAIISGEYAGEFEPEIKDVIPDETEMILNGADGQEITVGEAIVTEITKDELEITRTIKVGDITGKIVGKISDFKLKTKADITNKYSSFELSGNISVTSSIEVALSDQAAHIVLGGIDFGRAGEVTISYDIKADASITYSMNGMFKIGVTYDHGVISNHTSMTKSEDNTLSAEGNLSSELSANLRINLGVFLKGNAKVGVGPVFKANYERFSSGKPVECFTLAGHLYAGASANISFFGGLYRYSDKWILWDGNNSPLRTVEHYEDGNRVFSCTRGDSETKYLTSPESPYCCSGSRCVSSKEEGAGEGSDPIRTWRIMEYDDETVGITGYYGNASVLNVPAYIDGKKVTCILDSVFMYNQRLRAVNISEGIKFIGNHAFRECEQLCIVNFPQSLKSIGFMAFYGDTVLANVELNDGLSELYFDAFSKCKSLTYIRIPCTVKKFHSYRGDTCGYGGAFAECSNLKRVEVADGSTEIAEYLFYDCTGLEEVILPDTVKTIKKCAFAGCTKLQSISLPKNVESVGQYAFSGDKALTHIELNEGLQNIQERAFYNCTSLTGITIPSSLVTCTSAFSGCVNMKKAIITAGATEIPVGLFSGCTGLEKVIIPDTVTRINESAFSRCSNLKSLHLPDGVECIEEYAFRECESLSNIIIPDSVTMIRWGAFCGCSNLKTIIIPEGVNSIGYETFANCKNLREIDIPDSVTAIGKYAFYGCSSLKEISIPGRISKIGGDVWKNCTNLKSIRLPHSIKDLTVRTEGVWRYTEQESTEFAVGTSLTDIYYDGTEEDWNIIKKPSVDGYFDEGITIHYLRSIKPTATPTPAALKITGQVCGTGLSLKGKIGANVFLGFTDTTAVEAADPSVVINIDGKETVLKLTEQEYYTTGKKEIYEIQTYVPAKQINEKIELKLIDKNGNNISLRYGKKNLSSFTFSVSEITESYLTNYEQYGEKTIDLVTAIQNYCGYAQLMTGYKTNTAKITDQLTDISAKDLKPYATVVDKGSKIAKYAGTSLALQSDTTMQIYFKLMDNVDAYTITLDGEAVTPKDCGRGIYCVELKSIPAGKLSTASEIVISRDGETFTIKASALSWVESVLSNSKNQNQTTIDMAKMLYRYSQKADAYFA